MQLPLPRPRRSRGSAATQWQVPVETFGTVATEPMPIAAVLFSPRYEAGSSTGLVPLDPVEGLRQPLDDCFTLREQPRGDVEVLTRLMDPVDAHELTMSDLDPVVTATVEHLGRQQAVTARPR